MKIIPALAALLLFGSHSFGQHEQATASCSRATFAAFRDLPQIQYDCPENLTESSDELLKHAARVEALKAAMTELRTFNVPAWWNAEVDELNYCELHGKAGALNAEERTKLKQGDFRFSLFGDHQIRLVLLPDPCYQTGYNGSEGFLLYRNHDRVVVTRILEGYYSRIDNSVGIDVANVNGEQIIEISTANSMPPSIVNYYYTIDRRTGMAVPRQLFREGRKLTNEIHSAMIIGEPSDFGLPNNSEATVVMKRHRLLPTFSVYEDAYVDGDGQGRKLHRIIYRWNGRFYVSNRR
jgi:hypothetical protein